MNLACRPKLSCPVVLIGNKYGEAMTDYDRVNLTWVGNLTFDLNGFL
jgi:hypothetical protein